MERTEKLSLHKKALLEQRLKGVCRNEAEVNTIPKRIRNEPVPLSFSQRQMWVIDQLSPGNPAYNQPVGYRIKGNLKNDALEKSFNEIIMRHETLRTTLMVEDGQPVQLVHSDLAIQINPIDLSGLPDEEIEKRLPDLASEEAIRPFNLSQLPLIRVSLFKLRELEHILIINMHHAVADGWSLGILFDELDQFYRYFSSGNLFRPPQLSIQYGDYALWGRRSIPNESHQSQSHFWKNQLKGKLPTLELPCDKQRPAVQSFKGSNVFFNIPKPLTQKLQALGAKQGCTFFMVVLAAFQVILYRYSGAEDFVIGTPLSNRAMPELETMIGNFLNIVPLRADLSGNPTFRALLQRVREVTLDAFSNKDLPFEKVVENLQFERDPSRNPIFQVMLQVLPATKMKMGELEISNFHFDLKFAQFDLSLHLYEEEGGYTARFEYCSDLFNADTIERLSLHFMKLLEEIAVNPDRSIYETSILTQGERRQILFDWNDTAADYPKDKCLHQIFEGIAAKGVHRVAAEFDGKTLTYGEVNERANRLANYLVKSGVTPESIVGIFVERSVDLLVGLLGILKTGAAYVPMDPLFPPDRLVYMMADAGISTLVAHEDLLKLLPQSDRKTVCIDTQWSEIEKEDGSSPDVPADSKFLAYTIYTSGSTGKPKGVMIEHRSVVNFLFSMQKELSFKEEDVLVAVTTISFDIAVLELFLPLITGAKVVIAGKNEVIDGNLLLELIERTGATALQATPATWKLMIEAGWGKAPNLKMMCGGEPLPRELANQMLERSGELWNMYGPTETTIWSSLQKIEPGDDPILIGPPIANTQFYVVDKELEPVPIGVAGELLIGGDGLARGYFNRPDLTAEKFIADHFRKDGSRVYRTGDLARFRSNGIVEFLGRLDFQVKVRGFRIELGEIEHLLNQHNDIKEVVVVAQIDERQDVRLAAYIIPVDGKELNGSALRKYLAKKLPEYMVPSFFIEMDSFPLTPNAKIDRKAFPKPDTSLLKSERECVAPRDELEMQLAAIWQKALNVKRLGINDNFFELGGHSLLAAQVFARINKKIGMNLPLAILFQAPTIRQLGVLIRQKDWKPSWKSLVPIQATGDKPPLFLVHGAEGNVLLYRNLAHYLGDDQVVYGLQSRGLNGEEPLETDIRSMAEKYITDIKSVQPEGPYLLGGYCLGGTIALEMAHQLKAAGDDVPFLAMIETYNLKDNPRKISFLLKASHRFQNVYFQLRNFLQSQAGERRKYFQEKARVELSRFKIEVNILFSRILRKFNPNCDVKYQHLLVNLVNDRAQEQYEPENYDGKITLFRTKSNFSKFNDHYFGWGDIASGRVCIVHMPNYPRGSLNEPYVQVLSRNLKAKISEIGSSLSTESQS